MRESLLIKFCPSFLFYCYKDKSYNTLEYKIRRDTGYDNIIQHIRPSKTLYFLLNNNGNPEKVVTCNYTKYDLTEKIFEIKRNFPGMKIIDEKMTIENWLDGVPLDRSNHNDLKLVMNWLKTFQNKTKSEFLDMDDVQQEIEQVKNELDLIPEMSKIPYENWLDDYRHEFIGKKIQKTAVHGDFNLRNILIDHQNLWCIRNPRKCHRPPYFGAKINETYYEKWLEFIQFYENIIVIKKRKTPARCSKPI